MVSGVGGGACLLLLIGGSTGALACGGKVESDGHVAGGGGPVSVSGSVGGACVPATDAISRVSSMSGIALAEVSVTSSTTPACGH